jgi:hypothetical protein
MLNIYEIDQWCQFHQYFYNELFLTEVFCADFMCLQFGFVIFWQKDFGAKAAHKMLVKDTWSPLNFKDKLGNTN